MHPSKNLALMFVLGAVLVGGVLGFSADRFLVNSKEKNRESERERLARVLVLTETQQVTLDSLLDAKSRDLHALIAPIEPAIDSVSANTRAQIRAMLTPEQQATWDQLRREREERERARRDKQNKGN
jgi:Spy/CpxP family protein refolding chaperone